MVDTKRCSKCKETKSVTEFSKDRCQKDGLQSKCKSCGRQYYQENREKKLEYVKQYYQENRGRILKKVKQYRQENKEKIREYKKQYYHENRERILEYSRQLYQENRERRSENNKQYYQENRGRILKKVKQYRQENKEKIREYKKQYRQENRDYYLECSRRYVALKRSAIPEHLLNCKVERQRLVDIYALRQRISDATGIEYHVDHMWPLSKGGPHWSGNLQIIPADENLSKRDSVDEELVAVIQSALDEDVERLKRHGKDGSIRY